MSTEQIASDWLVSVTPAPRGDWLSPEGLRFNVTMHNGATADMVVAMIQEMDKLAAVLKPANGQPAPPSQPAQNTPPATTGNPPQGATGQGGGEGMEVYVDGGKRWIAKGEQFVVDIDRIIPGTTSKGNPTLELFRPGNEWKFSTVALRQQLDALSELSTGQLSEPVEMVFKVGNKKSRGDNHHIDFVGLATPVQQPPAPPADPLQQAGEELGGHVADSGGKFEHVGAFRQWADGRGYKMGDEITQIVGMEIAVAVTANTIAWFEEKMPPKAA